MFTLRLSRRDLQICALALAEAARKRQKGDSDRTPSRRLADTFGMLWTSALVKGEVVTVLTPEEAFVLRSALLSAAAGPQWYGSRTATPILPATFRGVAAMLEA